MFAGFFLSMMVCTALPPLSAWRINAAAQPAEAGQIAKGARTTKLVIAICNVTLRNHTSAGTVTRPFNYVFTDIHFGTYCAAVMATRRALI